MIPSSEEHGRPSAKRKQDDAELNDGKDASDAPLPFKKRPCLRESSTVEQPDESPQAMQIIAAAPATPTSLFDLPDDLIWKIFEYLDFEAMTRFGTANKALFKLSTEAYGYKQLCKQAGIRTNFSIASPREHFLREHKINPALVLAVSQYCHYKFPGQKEETRTKLDVECVLPRVSEIKMRARLFVHMKEHNIPVSDSVLNVLNGLYDQLVACRDAEADFRRAQLRCNGMVPQGVLSAADAYNLFLLQRPRLSAELQTLADFYRAQMRALDVVPEGTLKAVEAYEILVLARPKLSPGYQVVTDFCRAYMRAANLVPEQTLSAVATCDILASSRPHLPRECQALTDYFRAKMKVTREVSEQTLTDESAYNLLTVSRPNLPRGSQVFADYFRAKMRVTREVSEQILTDENAYEILRSLPETFLNQVRERAAIDAFMASMREKEGNPSRPAPANR